MLVISFVVMIEGFILVILGLKFVCCIKKKNNDISLQLTTPTTPDENDFVNYNSNTPTPGYGNNYKINDYNDTNN